MTINLTDPANHPANSPLPIQRIERVIEALESSLKYRNGSSMDHFIADAVKGLRELRESREAVPVADVVSWNKEGEERTCDIRWRRFDVAPGPLFTTPPVPAEMNSDKAWRELKISAEDCQAWSEGWNACRAAMLPATQKEVKDASC